MHRTLRVSSFAFLLPIASPAQVFFEGNGSLTDRWELSDSTRHGSFLIRPHRPVYFLVANWSNDPNKQPHTGKPGSTLPVEVGLQDTECKFQVSFKFKAWEGVFGEHGDLWLGYTQSTRWQLYNVEESRVFRETNYEPEALLNFATDVSFLGFKLRMLGGGLNHQSNGRSYFLTRSWNRLVAQIGFERPEWVVLFRPWWRIPEDDGVDENPEVEKYVGRGDLLVAWSHKGHQLSFLGRHSLDTSPGRGSVQLDWAIPVHVRFKGHVQVFHGYGESLLDFNHRQTTIGIGFSLIEWT